MVRANALSTLGRLPYSVHLMFYPSVFAGYKWLYKPWADAGAKAAADQEQEEMFKCKPLDPDLFNPFTPIPFHNNADSKYSYATLNMRNYIDPATGYNIKDYRWKGYHNSFDHGNKKSYLYDYTHI